MCDIDWGDLEPWKFSRTTTRKARKEHACSCCGRRIVAGENYRILVTLGDDFCAEKECAECMAMIDEFRRDHGTYSNSSYMPQMVRDCIEWEEDDEVKAKWQREIDRIEAVSV